MDSDNLFDWEFYINKYEDLRIAGINNSKKAWRHYNKFGKKEGRVCYFEPEVIEPEVQQLVKNKVLIIYVYYERKNEQKNQTNLAFFIKHGLNKLNWSNNLDITTLIVINDHQCEVIIPSNIFVLKEDNCSDYEGLYNGIKYMETKSGLNYEYLCLMNASTCGPFMEASPTNHWLFPFINKMNLTNSIACSPIINNWPISTNHPGLALSCHFILIKINSIILNLLMTKKQNINGYTNTFLGKKIDKLDAIFTGEMGLSKMLLSNNYNICSLYYDNNNIPTHVDNISRVEFLNSDKLKNTIFIKNIWRLKQNIYACFPVLYEYCSDFINKSLKQKKIKYVYDYNLLKVDQKCKFIIPGCVQNINTWNSKEEYYNKYGYAEEYILFPLKTISNGGVVIYTHYHPDNIVMDYVLESIKILMYLGYDIIFFTSSDNLNVDLPFKINYVKNQGIGTDWRMLLEGLNIIKKLNFKWVLFVNDSLLLGINGIDNMKKNIQNMRNSGCDFWGQWETNHVNLHLIGTPIEFKIKLIGEVIDFINLTLPICITEMDYVIKLEIGFTQHFKKYKKNSLLNDINFEMGVHGFFEPQTLKQWINKPETFAIKWKYCISYLNADVVSPEFNYLTRYLHYGPYGTISKGELYNIYPKSIDFKF